MILSSLDQSNLTTHLPYTFTHMSKITVYLIWNSNLIVRACSAQSFRLYTNDQFCIRISLCAWHVWLQQRENSVSTSRHWQRRRRRWRPRHLRRQGNDQHCIITLSRTLRTSFHSRYCCVSWEHCRCAIVYISQHYGWVTVLRYDVNGLVIHHDSWTWTGKWTYLWLDNRQIINW